MIKFSDFKNNIEKSINKDDDSRGKFKNLEVILDIVNSVNRSLILDDVLERVLKNAILLSNSERGFIVLKNNNGSLEFKLGMDNRGKNIPENEFNISRTVINEVFESGQSKFIEDAMMDNDKDPSKSIINLELQTILCSPLITEDKHIGVIYVDSKKIHKINDYEMTNTFEILAGQAATAIKNAQLYNGQINAYNALNEANIQLIQAERKVLKSSLDSEIGQSLQGLVHLALLEVESLTRLIERSQRGFETNYPDNDELLFDRLKLKSKIAVDRIRNIQKFAQALLETSHSNLNKDKGDINGTIQAVIKYLLPLKKYNKVSFSTEPNSVPFFRYDCDQIQHLLVHLISNAAEAKNDCSIKIKTTCIDNKVNIEVEDNGPGIPPEKKEQLFELPSNVKQGYGLFLCKSIVEKHNGSIEVSDTGKGTIVNISLPIN